MFLDVVKKRNLCKRTFKLHFAVVSCIPVVSRATKRPNGPQKKASQDSSSTPLIVIIVLYPSFCALGCRGEMQLVFFGPNGWPQ